MSSAVCISTDPLVLIHSRFSHPSLSKFHKMRPHFSTLQSLYCESCQLEKHTCTSFAKHPNKQVNVPFELVQWGFSRTQSSLRFPYFVEFIDDFSRCTWYSLRKKNQNYSLFFKKIMQKFKINFMSIFILYEVTMQKNIFSHHSPLLWKNMGSFTNHHVRT